MSHDIYQGDTEVHYTHRSNCCNIKRQFEDGRFVFLIKHVNNLWIIWAKEGTRNLGIIDEYIFSAFYSTFLIILSSPVKEVDNSLTIRIIH